MNDSHINVTVDLTRYGAQEMYDLRIPRNVTVKQLLIDLFDVLNIHEIKDTPAIVKIKTKGFVLAEEDVLIDHPVTDGDLLAVL
ncbi:MULTISPECIES: EsaB/YukD family protein [Allobacillus]|uniref:Ubiquitin n=1 Tax=Allobacillus salarius TaxID=1955272 RepID=A0A556PKQ2_9BACI|nr:EsaB/YukD family protein [Allobacillus salarius]TSJ64965.1 hypothetical protein FPQ13_08420 [Allobacillus salarius]